MASINEISKAVQNTLKLFRRLQASIKAVGLGVDENAIKDNTDKTLVELVSQLSLARKLLDGDSAFATASDQSRQYLTYSGVSWHEVALRAVSDLLKDLYISIVYDAPIDNEAKADLLLDLPAILPVRSWDSEAIQKCSVLDVDVETLLADVRSELARATMPVDESGWPTVSQAAEDQFVSASVISKAANSGALKSNGKKGRDRRIDPASLVTWNLKRNKR
ncbi:hypothetical protein [Bythopirellula polymerisocia]|uniref:Uncharacterized protein n=1 Tax=Bythopirellula polymerisocia TaxID=2528003 RepID=A0A5C6CX19_9BACT|nr:hypothetical protein [Bythopirellula polymerisocia]TWU27566.1 hypothetical protein Pla144_23430 [Bythopirellula polymerisocia]